MNMFTSTRKNVEPRKVEEETILTSTNGNGNNKPMNMTTLPVTKSMSQNASTFFSEDAELKGSLSFSTKLEFNGRFEGEIFADGPLVIGDKALIKGDIHTSSSVIIMGKVKGNVTAKQQVELKEMGHLYGDVKAQKFLIAEGAVFVGRSDTLEGKAPTEDFNNIFSKLSSKKAGGVVADVKAS